MTSIRDVRVVAVLVLLGALAIGSVTMIEMMRPAQDNAVLVGQIFGFTSTIAVASFAYFKSLDAANASVAAHQTAVETHQIVNSRFDEFRRAIEETARTAVQTAHAEGMELGRRMGRAEAERRHDEQRHNDRHGREDVN